MNKQFKNVDSLLQGGFIKIPRVVLESLFFGDEHEKLHARIYLFLLTESFYGNGHSNLSGRIFDCGTGELIITQCEIMELLDITQHSFKQSRKVLEERGLLRVETGIRYTRFILPFYEAITRSAGQPMRAASLEQAQSASPLERQSPAPLGQAQSPTPLGKTKSTSIGHPRSASIGHPRTASLLEYPRTEPKDDFSIYNFTTVVRYPEDKNN